MKPADLKAAARFEQPVLVTLSAFGKRMNEMKSRFCLIAVLACGTLPLLRADDCPVLSQDIASTVTKYLAQRLATPPKGSLSVESISLIANTCYHKVVIDVPGTAMPLTMYLSPDQRYLVSTLYDLTKDPALEAAQVAKNVETLLMRDRSPELAGRRSRLELVEFGDMQCPYCRRFADWYRSLPADVLDQVTLVFKHLPLDLHPWARPAAVLSACVSLQSTAAFWKLSDYFLSHQDEIGPGNIEGRALDVLATIHEVNGQEVMSCANGHGGSDLVARDVAAAKQLAVQSTPALFINGRKLAPLQSKEDLERLLERELNTSALLGSGGPQ